MLSVLTLAAILASLAVSFNLLLGIGRLFSVSQAAFAAFGAYAVAIGTVHQGWPYVPSLVIGVALGGLAGALVGAIALRVTDDFLAIATFGFQIVVTSLLINMVNLTGGASGIAAVPAPSLGPWIADTPLSFFIVALVVLLGTTEITRRVIHSPFGRIMRAVGQSESATLAAGRRPTEGKLALFALSGMLAAVGGGLYASYVSFLEPNSVGIHFSLLLLTMVIIGGAGTVLGPVIGATVMIVLPEALSFVGLTDTLISYIRQSIFSIVLILVIAVFGRGLVPPLRLRTLRPDLSTATTAGAGSSSEGRLHDRTAATAQGIGLRKAFGGLLAVDDVTVSIPAHIVTALVGPNGAGKTTLFNLLTGFHRPDAGRVLVDEVDLTDASPDVRCTSGLVRSFQDLRLFLDMTVIENVMVALPPVTSDSAASALLARGAIARAEARATREAREILGLVGLDERADHAAAELSYGDQKLLSFARCLASRPRVLLLDEPAAGLDPGTLQKFNELVREAAGRGIAVCVVEHNMQVVKSIADRIVFMHLGHVLREGTPAELMADPGLATLYFGTSRVAVPS